MNAHHARYRTSGFNLVELLVIIGVVGFLAVNLLVVLAATHKHSGMINCISNLKSIGVAFRMQEEAEAAMLFSRDLSGVENSKHLMRDVLTSNETMKLVTNGNAYLLWQTMSNDLSSPKVLYCPVDKRRKAAASFSKGLSDANISYFLSLDAPVTYPKMIQISDRNVTVLSDMILLGDRNVSANGAPAKSGLLSIYTNTTAGWTKEQHCFVGNLLMADGSAAQVTTNGLKQAVADMFSAHTNIVPTHWIIP
jgi:hypothetical protein